MGLVRMWKRTPDSILEQIRADMAAAEESGEVDQLFKNECTPAQLTPTRETLMESLKPGMTLRKSTFRKILGYEITTLGFADGAIKKLEGAGCSRAREYYTAAYTEYKEEHEKMMDNVADWYSKQSDQKEVRESRKQQEVEQRQMRSQLLMNKLQLLKQKRELLIQSVNNREKVEG